MPSNAPAIKREATASLGAEIVLVGPGSLERQIRAEELSAQYGYVIVPPFNDEKIVAGQGTMGLEILEDLPEVETVLVPVGGGGMLSGVATAIKLSNPSVKVIGVEPELAADAQASLRAGKIVQSSAETVSRTIADGLRTQSIGTINFEHIRLYVDDILTVSEAEIREAMLWLATNPKTVAEPSGAVAVAGFLFHEDQLPKTTMNVAIISGGNVDPKYVARDEDICETLQATSLRWFAVISLVTLKTMRLRLMVVAVTLLGVAARAETVRGTPIEVASIYLSPDSSSNKLADIDRGREVVILETSGDWLHVEAVVTEEKIITGWMMKKFVVQGSTPNGDRIVFGVGRGVRRPSQPTARTSRCSPGCHAPLLPDCRIFP